jgi:hypothetical protein
MFYIIDYIKNKCITLPLHNCPCCFACYQCWFGFLNAMALSASMAAEESKPALVAGKAAWAIV